MTQRPDVGQRDARSQPANAFTIAVKEAKPLRCRVGLSAIVRGDRKKIRPKDSSSVLGSVAIDKDCGVAYSQENRWDYAIGYSRAGGPVVFYVEVHQAGSWHALGEMEQKLDWLVKFLGKKANRALFLLQGEYCWVASGRIIVPPKQTSQYMRLEKLRSKYKLRGPQKHLQLA